MKKWLLIFVLLVAAACLGIIVNVGREGESRVESWLGRELRSIVGAGNRFTLEFDSLDFQAPNRVVVENMRFSLADSEGAVGPLIEVGKGTLELAKVPRWGEPIVLKTVRLVDPVVRVESFIAAARRETKAHSTTKPSLSSILTIQRVDIVNGTIRYDDGKGSPLSWNQLNAQLDHQTRDGQWHLAHVLIDQSPLMKADVAAEVNLDTISARDIKVRGIVDLNDPAALQFFTPPLQRLLSRFEVRGRAELAVNGTFDAHNKQETNLDARFTLSGANVSVGNFHVPVQRASALATMQGTHLSVQPVDVETLEGTVQGHADIELDASRMITAQAIVTDINLNQFLRSRSEGPETEVAGRVMADLRVKSNLADLLTIARNRSDGLQWGTGFVSVRDGRLVRIPVIEQLISATRRITNIFTGKGQNRDSFEAQFKLTDKYLDVSNMIYRGDGVGMRGKGLVGVNGEIRLVVNAGPLERIQETLGVVGQFWGRLTDRLMSYSVTGSLKSPVVRPTLGGG